MFKLVFGKVLSRYLFVLVCLTFVSGCVAILPTPDVTQHGDRLVVMETHVRADLTSINGMIKISREFYRHYEDEFDVLVLVYNTEDEIIDQWEPNAKGRWAGVRHAETGTVELPQFDGHLQLENDEESILWRENTTLWSIENRS